MNGSHSPIRNKSRQVTPACVPDSCVPDHFAQQAGFSEDSDVGHADWYSLCLSLPSNLTSPARSEVSPEVIVQQWHTELWTTIISQPPPPSLYDIPLCSQVDAGFCSTWAKNVTYSCSLGWNHRIIES